MSRRGNIQQYRLLQRIFVKMTILVACTELLIMIKQIQWVNEEVRERTEHGPEGESGGSYVDFLRNGKEEHNRLA